MSRNREKGVMTQGATLREENTGAKNVDVSSILKMQHLQRLATWASREAQIAPLAAFFGERLAAKSEASGISLDPLMFLCERCETILQPGINCTVRIERKSKRRRRSKKSPNLFQNNVIYDCHFCTHRNVKWGTRKGHVKGLLAARQGHTSKSSSSHSINGSQMSKEAESFSGTKSDLVGKVTVSGSVENPVTPLMKVVKQSGKKRKNSGSALKPIPVMGSGSSLAEDNSEKGTSISSKRRRKGWSSLKEIVESNQSKSNSSISNFAIPFHL